MSAAHCWILVLGLCLVPVLAGPAAADPDEIRERWDRMSAEEQDRVRTSYRRWLNMSDEDRELMRRRHENFQRLRDRVHDILDDEDRRRLRDLKPEERRDEMDRNARDFLRRVKESLPRELRDRLYESMHGVAPWDRPRKLSRVIQEEITRRLPRFVRSMVERGNISEAEAQQFHVRLAEAAPQERFRILRHLLLKDPEGFGVPPNLRDRWSKCDDPHRAVRMMDEMRPRRMSFERKLEYLAEEGVPEEEIEALRHMAKDKDKAEASLDEMARKHGMSSPMRMQRFLMSQGVPKDEIDAVFSGDRGSVRERLRELMDRHGLERPRDCDRDGRFPGNRDERRRNGRDRRERRLEPDEDSGSELRRI